MNNIDHHHQLSKIRYHCWRRGMKEMDLILGRFADRYLEAMDQSALRIFKSLLLRNDQELLALLTTDAPPPENDSHHDLLLEIRAFIKAGGAVI